MEPYNIDMTDLEGLRAFVMVAERGGFTAAAEALGIAQPVLSRRIQRLERELGVRVLDRGSWGSRLSNDGTRLLPGARRILETVADVEAGVAGDWRGAVRLGAAATAAGSFLAPALSRWIAEHPNVDLVMIEGGARRMRGALFDRECDLAVVAAPVPAEFEHRFLTTVRVLALFPAAHSFAASREPLAVSEFAGVKVLLNSEGYLSADLFEAACRLQQIEPEVAYRSTVGQTLAALAEAGLGVAIVGDSVDLRGFGLPRRVVVDAAGARLSFDLHLAWLRDRLLPAPIEQLVGMLTESSGNR